MSALVAVILPLALLVALWIAMGVGAARLAGQLVRLAPWLPLVLLWPLLAGTGGDFTWPLLGMRLGGDAVVAPLLVLTALAWSAGGWFAGSRITGGRRWFWTGWLGALGGMHLLLLAGDMASFYVGYALLSLSAYLLVTQPGSAEAWRAGRVYLVMALAGEGALLIGLLLIAGSLGNAPLAELAGNPAWVTESSARWWLLAGFAVKLGILPLHLWLPLAHPVAPVPASAVLSGVIVKAGLLGWLRFVPALEGEPLFIGQVLLALGLVTALGGVAIGLCQARLKTVLAYSTISQMGLVLTGFAVVFLVAGERTAMIAALGLFALHHGLNKASLFLACGCAPGASRGRLALFVLPALALAAAPLTTGDLAKNALKDLVALAPTLPFVSLVLSLTSTATALLMWKAFRLARTQTDARIAVHPAWPLMVVAGVLVPWAFAVGSGHAVSFSPGRLVDSLWPLILAGVLVLAWTRLVRAAPQLPEGDLVVPIERLLRLGAGRLRRASGAHVDTSDTEDAVATEADQVPAWVKQLLELERLQRRLPVAGLALLLVGGLLWLLTLFGAR